jgi:hypothetical protein
MKLYAKNGNYDLSVSISFNVEIIDSCDGTLINMVDLATP